MLPSIADDARALIQAIATFGQSPEDSRKGKYTLDGATLRPLLGWELERVNDAVDYLRERNLVTVGVGQSAHPYSFTFIELTVHERAAAQEYTNQAGDRAFMELAVEESRKCKSEAGKVSQDRGGRGA